MPDMPEEKKPITPPSTPLTAKEEMLQSIATRHPHASMLIIGIENKAQKGTEFIIDHGPDIDYKAEYIQRAYNDKLELIAMPSIRISGYVLTNAISYISTRKDRYVIFDQAQRLYLNFNQALDFLKLGHRVTREGWNGKNQWIKAQFPDEHSKMQQPYLYICPVTGLLTPWVPSQGDLFASDWLLIIEPETPSAKLPTKVN